MSKTSNYPDITYETLYNVYSIGQSMRLDKNYLNSSPYSEAIKKALTLIFPPLNVKGSNFSESKDLDIAELDIRKESEILYYQTKEIINSEALDEKDKASVLKTATTLLEKLLNIIERSDNITQMREFETRVLEIMKKVMPEQREQFLRELTETNNGINTESE